MKRFSRISALTSACILMAASFASCGAEMDSIFEANYVAEQSDECWDIPESADDSVYYDMNSEEYNSVQESSFKDTQTEPFSTFSADVDTASYANARRFINDNMKVPQDAVRIEEFINYFDYDYPQPDDNTAFGRYAEISDCPWNASHKLMLLGIQGEEMYQQETPPSNIVFLIDSSGSMDEEDKIPLVRKAFSMLADTLSKNDRISIVTYAGSSSTLLKGEPGNNKKRIKKALDSVTASGSTNGEGGINTAYALAEKYFIEGGNNRVILATDGDLNVGASSQEELTELIESKRDMGIYLSVLGFGTGNYKDARMEAVADNGNGNFSYIDSVEEAKRVLVDEMSSTLYTIAKDVKLQVEFNPSEVKSYRLIGYDNRVMSVEDFNDVTKDAGEVGAGDCVTVLYELELTENGNEDFQNVQLSNSNSNEPEKTFETSSFNAGELCKLSIRYKDIDTEDTVDISDIIGTDKFSLKPSDAMYTASAVTEYGMLLKDSKYKGDSSFKYVNDALSSILGDEKTDELIKLAKKASRLYD